MRPVSAFAVGAAAGVLASRVVHSLSPKPMTTFRLPDALAPAGSLPFEEELSALTHSASTTGNEVQVLDGTTGYANAFLEALERAEDAIWFEMFWWREGRFARMVRDALLDAVDRGVQVRLLLDGYGAHNGHFESVDALREAGVEVEIIYPVHPMRLRRINNSTHRRILIVDHAEAYTGGVGIDDRWLGKGDEPPWADLLVRLRGPAVQRMAGVFADHWRLRTGESLAGAPALRAHEPAGDARVQVLHSGPDSGAVGLRLAILYALSAARETVRIVTPYFIPDDLVRECLVKAQRQGVDVELILAGEKTDQPAVRRASRSTWGPLLRSGVTIREYQPTNVHTKAILLDDRWSLLGSMNLDERSLRHNAEIGIGTGDPTAMRTLGACIDRYRDQCVTIGLDEWRQRPKVQRTEDRLAGLLTKQM